MGLFKVALTVPCPFSHPLISSRRVTQVSWWSWGQQTGPMPSTPPCADQDALTRSWRFVHTVKTY